MTTINFNLAKQTHTADVRVLVTRFYNGDGELVINCQCIINTIDGKSLPELHRATDIIEYEALKCNAKAHAINEYKKVENLCR